MKSLAEASAALETIKKTLATYQLDLLDLEIAISTAARAAA